MICCTSSVACFRVCVCALLVKCAYLPVDVVFFWQLSWCKRIRGLHYCLTQHSYCVGVCRGPSVEVSLEALLFFLRRSKGRLHHVCPYVPTNSECFCGYNFPAGMGFSFHFASSSVGKTPAKVQKSSPSCLIRFSLVLILKATFHIVKYRLTKKKKESTRRAKHFFCHSSRNPAFLCVSTEDYILCLHKSMFKVLSYQQDETPPL